MFLGHRLISVGILASFSFFFRTVPMLSVDFTESFEDVSPLIVSDRQQSSDRKSQSATTKVKPEKAPLRVILDEILKRLQRQKVSGTSRGGICAIAPGILEKENRIISDRPLFMWYGEADKLILKNDENQIIWTQVIAPGTTSIKYAGPSLQPGQYYSWYLSNKIRSLSEISFMLMPSSERETELNNLQLDINSSQSPRLATANYFLGKQFWSDTLTALHLEKEALSLNEFFIQAPKISCLSSIQ